MDNKKNDSYKFSLTTLKGVFSKSIAPRTYTDETGQQKTTKGSYILGAKSGDMWNSTFISKSLVSINKDLDGTRLGITMYLPKKFKFNASTYNLVANEKVEQTIEWDTEDIKNLLLSKNGVELITV